jgi:hypothetical protein
MANASLLRAALRFNAVFSLSTGVAALLLAERLARSLNLPATALSVVGMILTLYGVVLGALSYARRAASAGAATVTALDIGWVLGSLGFVAIREAPASWLVLVTAAVVLACALLQLAGLHRAIFVDGLGHFDLEREVRASAERVWSVVSDVARYAEVAGTLHKSEIVSGEGIGLVRRCEDKNGICWLETCTRWEPGRAYAFEVDTSAPGYPLPLRTMRGDFEVERVTEGRSKVRIRFTFAVRGGARHEVLLALLFAASGDRLVGAILQRWAKRIEEPGGEGELSAVA